MNGVTVGGIKYMYLQSDDNQIQAKKGATGVSVAKAGKCKLLKIAGCLITRGVSIRNNHISHIYHTE